MDAVLTPYEVKSVKIARKIEPDIDAGNDTVGVMARAEITMRLKAHPDGYSVSTIIDSPGLWGIEADDDDPAYRSAVYEEEVRELLCILAALGVAEDRCEIAHY